MADNKRIVVDLDKIYERELYQSLTVSSSAHSFSLCIEYMKKWFLDKFNDDMFKSVYLDGKHVLDEIRTMKEIQKLKRLKPSLAISASMDWDFNNDRIDSYPWGTGLYVARGKFKNAIMNDDENDVHLGIGMETCLYNFNFKVRLSTRAEQMDIYKYMKLACRVGFTQGEDISMDFHVPYSMMLQMAKDLGFYIKEDKIVNVTKFLSYLNKHSTLPFIYKYRCINGHSEFFLRLDHLYVHIQCPNINADDGEREGQLMTNYTIELQAQVRFPSPNFYSYYSKSEHEGFVRKDDFNDNDQSVNIFVDKLAIVPSYNEYKWPKYITTGYSDDGDSLNTLTIDFNELFEGDLKRIIDWTLDTELSPSKFIEIKVFEMTDEMTGDTIDWKTMIWKCNKKDYIGTRNNYYMISIYCDLEYISNALRIIDEYDKSRLEKSSFTQ